MNVIFLISFLINLLFVEKHLGLNFDFVTCYFTENVYLILEFSGDVFSTF